MMFLTALLALPAVLAQTKTTTSTAAIATHTIAVGQNGNTFSPDTVNATFGSVIQFQFFSPKHSVAHGAYVDPCHPNSNDSFYSGVVATSSGSSPDFFSVTLNNTDPIWFYCGIPGHCEGGMVGVINPPENGRRTLDEFKANATKAKDTRVPGDARGGVLGPVQAGTASTTTLVAATTSSGSSSTSSGAAATTSKPSNGVQIRGTAGWAVVALSVFAGLCLML